MKKYKSTVITLVLALCLVLIIAAGCETNTCPQIDKTAPDFTLMDLKGQKITLSELKGQTIIINFWAISCPYCVFELPFFQIAYDEFSKKNHVFLMVNSKEDTETVNKYISEKNFTFPVLLDKDSKVTLEYCLPGLPGTIIVDPRGILLYGKLGAFKTADELLRTIESF